MMVDSKFTTKALRKQGAGSRIKSGMTVFIFQNQCYTEAYDAI